MTTDCKEEPTYLPLVDIMDGGLESHDDYTLDQVVHEFRRRVISATIEATPTKAAAARALGVTRRGLYLMRVRYGLEIDSASQTEKPIPGDFRDRLAMAPPSKSAS